MGGKKTKEEVRIEVDRISLLPDDILSHILSPLPTKDAVRLSILSKRWRFVWTSVPIIKIDYDGWDDESPEMKERFVDFVDRVLSLNDVSNLQKFHLKCYNDYDSSRVSSWISTVIKRDIEKLSLTFWDQEPLYLVKLPLNMFTSKKLVTLKLRGDIVLNVFPAVYLTCLKILHLLELQSLNDDSVKNLLAGCPVLEEFHITRSSYGDNLNTLFVQSISLKSFHVKPNVEGYCDFSDVRIVVDAINLEEIYLDGCVPQQFEVIRSTSLVKVKLDLWENWGCCDETVEMAFYGGVAELLRQISNTKHLAVSMVGMKAHGYTCLDNLPRFHNLTHLKMVMYSCGWTILPYLFDCSPNLVSLLLDLYSSCGKREYHQQYHTPRCSVLHLHLGKIELANFFGDRNEMKMVSYFLKNSLVLKKMSIAYHPSLSLNQKSEVRDKIFALPKGSTDFEFEFIERSLSGGMWSSTSTSYKLQGCCMTHLL